MFARLRRNRVWDKSQSTGLRCKIELQIAVSAIRDAPLGPADPAPVLQELCVAVRKERRVVVSVVRAFPDWEGLVNSGSRGLQDEMIRLRTGQGMRSGKLIGSPRISCRRVQREARSGYFALFDERARPSFEANR